MCVISLKRVYEKPDRKDGFRILVDRLWPRGISKEKGKIDLWLKEIAPSDGLRKWFGHVPEKFAEFRKKYNIELEEKSELIKKIKQLEKEKKTVTLLYSARDGRFNNAVVLKEALK
ncbi:MAG TPA: DUF488 family protein [Candidatus Nanoarchaeia archaeon]|nr:DUF488 family protein [Candidatus Nanoarchaeia archaeon]